jgi:hypothetical protein
MDIRVSFLSGDRKHCPKCGAKLEWNTPDGVGFTVMVGI